MDTPPKGRNGAPEEAALRLKKKLRSRSPVFGLWTSIGHPSITEIFARSGADFVGIDMEHSTISQAEAQRIIAASHAAGVPCLPRISSHNAEQVKRLLDSGADGIIVPMVNTRAEADRMLAGCLYPPLGARSYGIARAQGYGFDFESYAASWNSRAIFIPQIESRAGVASVNEILADARVDGLMLGPYDLSGSLGIPGQLNHPDLQKACREVIEACRKAGKACGTQVVEPNRENVAEALRAGSTFVVLASDVFLLWKWSERMRSLIAEAGKGGSPRPKSLPRAKAPG